MYWHSVMILLQYEQNLQKGVVKMADKLTMRDIRPRKGKLDDIPVEQLKADRERMSVAYMANHYGVSKATMYRALRKAGLING